MAFWPMQDSTEARKKHRESFMGKSSQYKPKKQKTKQDKLEILRGRLFNLLESHHYYLVTGYREDDAAVFEILKGSFIMRDQRLMDDLANYVINLDEEAKGKKTLLTLIRESVDVGTLEEAKQGLINSRKEHDYPLKVYYWDTYGNGQEL